MSENNYGALMMKSTVGVSDDINAILSPGIYLIPSANTSSPDSLGGVLTIHSGSPIRRTFISDSIICLTSTRNGNTWTAWRGPLSRTNPFADIKADGAAAIAEALSNLGLKQLATLNGIGNSFPFFDGSNTVRLSNITTVGRTVVAAEKIADIVNYLGITELLNGKQPLDATLTAIAALASSANKLPYFTGEDTVAITDLTAFARTILGRSDAAGVLSDLGLGPIATAADIQSGTAKKMVDASGLKSFLPKRNFAANDFVRIPDVPGGLIIQWGVVLKSIPEGVKNVIFPTPFPNFSLMAMATPINSVANPGIDVFSQVGGMSNSDVNFVFAWISTQTPADGFRWFALGF